MDLLKVWKTERLFIYLDLKNKQVMKHEIIYIEDYALIVSDETPTEGDFMACPEDLNFPPEQASKSQLRFLDSSIFKKIVGHRPLKDAPVLEGVPLLPEFGQEDDVEDWIKETSKDLQDRLIKDTARMCLKAGYNKAKETYNLTLSKLLDLYVEKTGYGMDMWSKEENNTMSVIAEIIQSLQQPKRLKYFECEMEQLNNKPGSSYSTETLYKPKTISNSQGQTELVGEYFYE